MRSVAHEDRDSAENAQVRFLSSPAVHQPLQVVLEQRGLRLERAELVDLQHRPGAGATGVFRVHATGANHTGSASSLPSVSPAEPAELYLALTAEKTPPEAVVDAGMGADTRWSGWFHPHDPLLTGLALACDPESVAALWGRGASISELQTVSYRPLRRAVLRAVLSEGTERHTVFLKVMRDGLATPLHHRHVLLAAAGIPVPTVLGPPVADVLALSQGDGEVLANSIMADGGRHLDPAEIVDVLDRMPSELLDLPRRDAWADRVAAYGHAAATALPHQARRIQSLVEHVQRQLDSTDRGPVVPAHGDFYEANLLVRDHRITGVLDIDGAGPGHRVDDLACFLGHLAVLPAVDSGYVFVWQALRRFHSHFVETVDPKALACRSAAVALSLVAGARDSGRSDWQSSARQRLEIAESLLQLPQSAAGW
ncbi:phosphotransferase [Citricoccus sp. GCM10030269]|uniref:phosphotransferase n=1 Tax=Citricoccus sp. GCM10030269 TaxID=3273388 RepID=UPI0036228F60